MAVNQRTVRVAAIKQVAPMIREFCLVATSGDLPPFSAGSHIMLEMKGAEKTYRNAYSLVGDPLDTSAYRIAVRLQQPSRGGSVFMHQSVKVGDELNISMPINLFAPHWRARKHLLIAGGVGITPFMSYLPEMLRRDCQFELHYLYRSQQTGAYPQDLTKQFGTRLFSYDSDLGQRCELQSLLAQQTLGTHIYICGPVSLIEAIKDIAKTMGIPLACIHYEEFTAHKPGEPFDVEVKSTGQSIRVGSDESILEALESADLQIPNMCRGGVCGQCICTVAAGEVEHRDSFLSEDEKASSKLITPCVSRALSARLVLDI